MNDLGAMQLYILYLTFFYLGQVHGMPCLLVTVSGKRFHDHKQICVFNLFAIFTA